MLRFYLNTLALERFCLMHIMSMEYADLCFVYDFFFNVIPLSYLIIMIIH